MEKYKYFAPEIEFIKNNDIKSDLISVLEIVPDYFFEVSASSTGKYHPSFSQNKGGLLRHTKAAARIAHDLLSLEMYNIFSDREKDLIIYALIMHDGFKHGKIKGIYTSFDHPLIAGEEVYKASSLPEKEKSLISSMIKSHMGEWNTNKYSSVTLPKPKTECEKFVHMCDCLSSKKYLNIEFIENEVVC